MQTGLRPPLAAPQMHVFWIAQPRATYTLESVKVGRANPSEGRHCYGICHDPAAQRLAPTQAIENPARFRAARQRSMMKLSRSAIALSLATALGFPLSAFGQGMNAESREPRAEASVRYATPHSRPKTIGARGIETRALSAVVQRYCQNCHNPKQIRGNHN